MHELLQGENGEHIIAWLERDREKLMSSESIPDDDISSVKAHKRVLKYLEDKIAEAKRIRNNEESEPSFGEYE